MCFSMTADVVVGTALVPVAAASLKLVRNRREVLFAALPALFALHQFMEVAVWAGLDGDVSPGLAELAMRAYLFIAWPLLPTYVPLAVMLLEPPERARPRAAPFLALGLVVSAYLAYVVLFNPVEVIRHPNGLEYATVVTHPMVWAVAYIVAVIGPPLLSGYRSIVVFGALNLVGLITVAIFYAQAFASLWCIFAAVSSVLILIHMIRRRATPEADRLPRSPQPAPA
ncbi:MAG: hypothetical protein KDB47_02830 [Mycobacterium sp.]|nr:hypothetical protein [Mycobacterium sp.]